MKIIRRTRWSLRLFSQIYECELPRGCRNPLERARDFFAGRNIKRMEVDGQSLRFSRGSWFGNLFSYSDVHSRHGGYIHLNNTNDGLICEYSIISLVPSFTIPPWPLQQEVEELEAWLAATSGQTANVTPNTDLNKPQAVTNKPSAVRPARSSMNLSYKILYRLYRLFSWMAYWIARRFTRTGMVLMVATLVALFLGLDPENSVGYQGLTLLIGILLASMLFAFGFRGKFTAERLLPRFGTVGQPFTYRVTVRNLTSRPQAGLQLLEKLRDIRPNFEQWRAIQVDDSKYVRPFRFNQRRRKNPFRLAKVKEAILPTMPAQKTAETSVELTPLRRGVIHFDGVTIARPDPLGITRALKKVVLPQSVLILPKRYYIPPLALPGVMKYQQGGVALASNVGQSDEFVALREYRRGDPVRHIHWRSWAKFGKPIVKEFEDEFFVRHALVLDTYTDRPHTDEFEEAVSVAASFACTVLTQESLLDLLFVGTRAHCFTAGRGLAHADQMLEILASVQPTTTATFERLEELVVNHANLVSGCICVLLAWDNARQRLVEKLKAFNLPVMVIVIRPAGKTEPLEPGPMRDEPERLIALEVDKVEQQLVKLA